MRSLIVSDIHANLEALEAVLAAAGALPGGYDELWNLGDMVGYGGSPNQVIERIRPLSTLTVRGNHDRVCCGLTSPNNFNPVARAAALWTREALTPPNLAWLREVAKGPLAPAAEGVSCVHGSPLNEDQYILTMRDAWAPLQGTAATLTFFGHTHIQGGFSQREHEWHELRPRFARTPEGRNGAGPSRASEAASWTMALQPGTRHLINPGSVGQPRDHDWRAGFAIYDANALEITFFRVPYDVLGAQGRILMAELPERLAARLREGR